MFIGCTFDHNNPEDEFPCYRLIGDRLIGDDDSLVVRCHLRVMMPSLLPADAAEQLA
jgi:hypothetical protein